MIKINLLGEVKEVDNTIKLQVAGFAGTLVVLLLAFYFLYSSTSSQFEDLTERKAQLNTEINQLKKVTNEVRELEKKRQDLQDKIIVIAKLKKNKLGPVKLLDDLNQALPEKAWLREMRESSGTLKSTGLALDNQTIATFMKNLEKSEFFLSVDLVETRQQMLQGVNMKLFTIQSNISYAGKFALALQAAEAKAKEEKEKAKAKAQPAATIAKPKADEGEV